MTQPLDDARRALDDFAEALAKLDAGCCDPGRSPRMRALAEALSVSRGELARVGADPDAAPGLNGVLEDMGAAIGRLQVGCCTEKRLPLYARMLDDLTATQIAVARATGTAH